MHAAIAVTMVLVAAAILFSAIGRARSGATAPAGRSGKARQSARHEARLAWTRAKAANWLEQQRHYRKTGQSPPANPAVRAAGNAARQTGRAARKAGALAGFVIRPPQKPAGSSGTPAPPPPQGTPKPPPPGRNQTMAASSGSAEKLIEGVNQVHAEAAAGGIHAKHGAIKSCTEGSIRFSQMSSMMSRAMSEPGSSYGPEITEPLAKAAVHLQAAAMAFSESDAALTTLLQMSVGDLARSARQAPHHAELSENGSR